MPARCVGIEGTSAIVPLSEVHLGLIAEPPNSICHVLTSFHPTFAEQAPIEM